MFIIFQDQGFDVLYFPYFSLVQKPLKAIGHSPLFSPLAVQIHLGAALRHLAKSGKLFPPADAYPSVGRTCLVITWAGWKLQSRLYSRDPELVTYHTPAPCSTHTELTQKLQRWNMPYAITADTLP